MIKVLIYATSCPTPNHILSAKLLARLNDARPAKTFASPTIILAGTGVNNDRYLTFCIIPHHPVIIISSKIVL